MLRGIHAAAIIIASLSATICRGAGAEQPVKAVLPPEGKFTYIERADLRRYESGKYVGLEYREVRGILQQSASALAASIEGTFYVLQALDHSGAHTSQEIDHAVPVTYAIQPDGAYAIEGDGAYPTLRGFPIVPKAEISVGNRWTGVGMRLVEPLHDGKFSRVRFYSDYRYDGEVTQGGETVRVITAAYAVRYKKGDDPAGDVRLQSISGNHAVSIQLSAPSGALSFMRDQMDETYAFVDGTSVQLKGFVLTWFTSATPLNREETADKIAKKLEESGTQDVVIEQKKEGISVSLNNIHFVAEQATFLPDELSRLEALAGALKLIEGRSFHVIGHTAAVGTPESQYDLSVKRAKAVVDFLASHGISAGRFLYEGRGGTEPVAPSDTEENMAKNRRVEIFILED
ncbi:MAG: OmpA family protein [Spirochaetia bacterium]|jgi:outer membrane protein OmpA-like peptidoglycan-associated protein